MKNMTRKELIAAMDAGLPVRWHHEGYHCYKASNGDYLQTCTQNGSTIGIFHLDGVGMNLDPADCYIADQ